MASRMSRLELLLKRQNSTSHNLLDIAVDRLKQFLDNIVPILVCH
jgi:hypothetical protein